MGALLGYLAIACLILGAAAIAASFTWLVLSRGERAGEGPEIIQTKPASVLTLLSRAIERSRAGAALQRLLAEADVEWSAGAVTLASAIGFLLTATLLGRLDFVPGWAALAAACIAAAAPTLYIRGLRAKRLAQIEEQLPEALEFISRALVAGHSLPMSMELLAEEIGQPMSGELRKTVDEYNLGLSIERALENLTVRAPSVDIRFFASAIATQSRTGGSLHELLESLSETIRERATLKNQVKALTANARMSALVLSLLPFFIAGVMFFVNRDYFQILLDSAIGRTLLFFALCGQAAAYFVIRRIVNIRV